MDDGTKTLHGHRARGLVPSLGSSATISFGVGIGHHHHVFLQRSHAGYGTHSVNPLALASPRDPQLGRDPASMSKIWRHQCNVVSGPSSQAGTRWPSPDLANKCPAGPPPSGRRILGGPGHRHSILLAPRCSPLRFIRVSQTTRTRTAITKDILAVPGTKYMGYPAKYCHRAS